jgi:hypothetical protein
MRKLLYNTYIEEAIRTATHYPKFEMAFEVCNRCGCHFGLTAQETRTLWRDRWENVTVCSRGAT